MCTGEQKQIDLGSTKKVAASMSITAENIEEEVGRTVEDAKELQDLVTTHISKTSIEEQSLRQRALSLNDSIKRLRSLLDSLLSQKLLDPKVADKVKFYFSNSGKNQLNFLCQFYFRYFKMGNSFGFFNIKLLYACLKYFNLPTFFLIFYRPLYHG